VFPAPTQVVPQVIELPSSHWQLTEKVGELDGNVRLGLKFPEFCIAFSIPVVQLEPVMSDWHVELFAAYSAPARAAPSRAAVLAPSLPTSAIPITTTTRIGAAKANSMTAVPPSPKKPRRIGGVDPVTSCLRLIGDLSWREQPF